MKYAATHKYKESEGERKRDEESQGYTEGITIKQREIQLERESEQRAGKAKKERNERSPRNSQDNERSWETAK